MYGIDRIFIIRYLLIPLAGAVASGASFFFVYKCLPRWGADRVAINLGRRVRWLFLFFISICIVYFFITISLRYYTHHLAFFDFGIYDWRIWRIHAIAWAEWPAKLMSSTEGHFQPVLVLHSILYDFGMEPVVLNLLQAAAVLSGVIPLFLTAREKTGEGFLVYAVCILYLLYPATQFNMAIEFHPDYLVIPLLLWSYYFIEKGYCWPVFLCALGAYAIKEPYMLSFAFLGVYMAWDKKRVAAGVALLALSMTVFFIATFVVSSSIANYQQIETVTGKVAYGYLFEPGSLKLIVKEVLDFKKWRFPFFLLAPLFFLPLAGFKAFLPAVPILAVQMLSIVTHHQSVGSHYTAGIIAPVFISFVVAAERLRIHCGTRVFISLLSAVFVLTVFFDVAHSPSPMAVAFWDSRWSHGRWHYTNYISDSRKDRYIDAIACIPPDPEVRVVTHSLIYDKRLAHRYSYSPFPERWQKADYILLDNRLEPYVVDSVDRAAYLRYLEKLTGDKRFTAIYDREGVMLFKRRGDRVVDTRHRRSLKPLAVD